MQQFAKILISLGLFLVLIGVVLYVARSFPFLGRLPGDIRIEKPNFVFYFPITTSILISLILSLIFYLISRFR
ncbi:MAG: DUF2905 domain-containing protein [candidate division KSB1 bacterium]|nr:DUF2905 domain-containing protein [candidate division KSB1 bacterium]MDQ7063996.1 DUF2905 domain-containing protein [candidate division KSB1 bacterium]